MAKKGPLTRRETEILGLIAQGMSNDEIAHKLTISVNTVKVHVRNIFEKMQVQSRTEATIEAVKRGWVVVPGMAQGEKAMSAPPAWQPLRWQPGSWLWGVLGMVLFLALATLLLPVQTFYARTNAPSFSTDTAWPVERMAERVDVPRWSQLSSMPTARSRAAAAVLDDGWHIIGGEDAAGDMSLHELYNPAWDQWQTLPARPVAARGAAAAGLDDLLYVAGGCANATALARFDVFDTVAGTWQVAPALPAPRCGLAMTRWRHQLYAFGGWDGVHVTDSLYIFDPVAGQWRSGPALPQPRAFAAVVALRDEIYLLGGTDGATQRAEVWRYLPGKEVWESAPALPEPRSGLAVTADAGSLYVITGGEGADAYPHERFDLASQSWSTLDVPRRGPWHHAVAAMIGPNLHIAGGWGGDYLAIHEVYQASHLIFLPAQGGP